MKDDRLYVEHIVLVHEYLGINLQRVWDIVRLDLPPLREQMEVVRSALP